LFLNVSSVRITYGKNYYSTTGHTYMIFLRWRMRVLEGKVIGNEFKGKEKIR